MLSVLRDPKKSLAWGRKQMKYHHFITQQLHVAPDQANRDFFFSG